jgi:hypothetical protein
MKPSITESRILEPHDQAAGILYCIARRLWERGFSSDPNGWEGKSSEAYLHWAMLRNVADHFMRAKTTRIGAVRIANFCCALNFAHAFDRAHTVRQLLPLATCACETARLVRELAVVRGETLHIPNTVESPIAGAVRG